MKPTDILLISLLEILDISIYNPAPDPRKRYERCSKLTIKIPEHHIRHSSVFTVNVEHISQLFLVFLLLN